MKHIVKSDEPEPFTRWKASGSKDWQPEYGSMPSEIKGAVKSALMADQGCICCYCENSISDRDSHIEHFRPQNDSTVNPLDFDNMLCSCQNQTIKGKPLHCGHRKGAWFDQDMLLSPLERNCEGRFSFSGIGEITPRNKDDQAASETINRLGLGIPKLNDMRAKAIEPFLDDGLSAQEFQCLVGGYLQKDKSGAFGAFWSTIRYLFGESVST